MAGVRARTNQGNRSGRAGCRANCGCNWAKPWAQSTKRSGNFLWLTGFPLFEWSDTDKAWVSAQHPFTGIVEEDLEKLESAPWEVRSKGYDLVLNGVELGSGSIRIHRQDVQERLFKALGLTRRTAAASIRLFSRCADVRHASARRHRSRPRSRSDAPCRRKIHSRGDRLRQNRAGGRFDGGISQRSRQRAARSVGDRDHRTSFMKHCENVCWRGLN